MKLSVSLLFSSFVLLLVSGCASKANTGSDHIVSVSVVNTTPNPIGHMRFAFRGDLPAVTLSDLPGYEEVSRDLNPVPLQRRHRVTVERLDKEGTAAKRKSLHLAPPGRKDLRGEYNLRIQIPNDGPLLYALEPVGLLRARMKAPGREIR